MTNWSNLIEVVVASGAVTAVIQFGRGLLNRRKVHVDSADVVQGMALKLVTPFTERLAQADADLDAWRRKFRELQIELDRALERARAAEDQLLKYGIPIPTREKT